MRQFVRIGLLALVTALSLSGAAGAGTLCDEALQKDVEAQQQDSKSPLAYRMRGDRCEGIYAQEVSTVSIDVRSFVVGFGPFDPQKTPALTLRWQAPPGVERNVRLRAFCFKPHEYYRMDTAVPATRQGYRWPGDVLAALSLGGQDLGVIAWVEMPGPGGTAREVYLPLRAGATAAAKDGYQVSLVPSVRLKEIHLTLSRLDAKGSVVETLFRGKALGYGHYPSNEPTRFSTGKLGAAGFYRLDIASSPVSGRPVKQGIEFYHPGDGRSPR